MGMTAETLVEAAEELAACVDELKFSHPVSHVYNPLRYAWDPHRRYLQRYGCGSRRVLFVGMNPGPWGMAQTGVPFGEVEAVTGWLGIRGRVDAPDREHPRRPVFGFDCERSEVSGRRLWGLMRDRFGSPDAFFANHFVGNYCPLVFLESSGRNRTPDRLPADQKDALYRVCDRHLRTVVDLLRPEWLIGIGRFAEERILAATEAGSGSRGARCGRGPRCGRILHPSPANPQANRDWAGQVEAALVECGVWARNS